MAKQTQQQQFFWVMIVGVLIVILVGWSIHNNGKKKDQTPPPTGGTAQQPTQPGDGGGNASTPPGGGTVQPPVEPGTPTPPVDIAQPLTQTEAQSLFAEGLRLQEDGKLIAARTALSRAYFSDQLTATQASRARAELAKLANQTLFSGTKFTDDPYTMRYQVKGGDMFVGKNGIERGNDLHVPEQLLMKINRISRPESLQVGATLTLIKGPFHAVIDKSDFTMDIYLHREGLEKVFIRRVMVGLGRENSTPAGLWKVQDKPAPGGPWYPPAGSGLKGIILHGEPNYAFGEKGIWIALEGIDNQTRPISGIGIHSTDKPDSIGTMDSLGCIRLGDADIETAHLLLYPQWSTITVKP